MPSQTAHKTQIYLSEKLYRYLKGRARREGVSMAAIIRRLLEESVERKGPLADDPFLSLGNPGTETGIRDGARFHDEHIYGRRR